MEFAELQPDLQQWMRDMVQRGYDRAGMMDALLKTGYQPSIASAVDQCIADSTGGGKFQKMAPAAVARAQTANHTEERGEKGDSSRFRLFEPQSALYDLGDRQVEVLLTMRQPNIVLFGNLLSENECDALVEMSRTRLKRSRVVNAERGTYDLGEARTSEGTYFERAANPLIADIETRIERLLGVPEVRGEPIQVLHYREGAQYRPHFDYFETGKPGSQRVLAQGGQRVGTLIMYLNNVKAGGSTVFPEVALDVFPKKGCGLFFSYSNATGEVDRKTFHGGSPVLAGEKWIATKWLRLGEYRVADA